MVRKYFSVGIVMNMVTMHLNVLKEKRRLRVDSKLEDLEIVFMLMKKKMKKNLIKEEVKMN